MGSVKVKEKYIDLYKSLVSAYYSTKFEETLEYILSNEFEDKNQGKEILALICGVEVNNQLNEATFAYNIVNAITEARVKEKIVQKIGCCNEDCENIDGKSKCQRICPFDAIIKLPNSEEKWIDDNLCMDCGRCIEVCDKYNYMATSDFLPLSELLKSNHEVIAIVAPAIAGQFGENVSLDQLREAFIRLGFKDMLEVALGADVLSIKEAIEFNNHVHKTGDFMITSCCCPVWINLLKKVYNKLMPEVSPSVSPMIAMGRIIKTMNNNAEVVFIGPCLAKKSEARDKELAGAIDYVLTFEEVKSIFEALKVSPKELKGVPSIDYASTGGRLYARSGGVTEAVWDIVDELFLEKRELFSSIHVDGVRNCQALLKDLEDGNVKASFIEGMGCTGGCVGGPKVIVKSELGRKAVDKEAYSSAIKIPVHSKVLMNILNNLGIEDLEKFKDQCAMFEREFK